MSKLSNNLINTRLLRNAKARHRYFVGKVKEWDRVIEKLERKQEPNLSKTDKLSTAEIQQLRIFATNLDYHSNNFILLTNNPEVVKAYEKLTLKK